MNRTIKVTIDESVYSWDMCRYYDPENTAFIWVEREMAILDLTPEMIPDRPRGWNPPAGTCHGPKKLFLMRHIGMVGLPEWCVLKGISKPRIGDTHEWFEIIKPSNNLTRLERIDKPIALIKDCLEWRLIFEDDNPQISHESRCQTNLFNYGLIEAANNLTIIPLEALNSSFAT
jgi:hypothetical protein